MSEVVLSREENVQLHNKVTFMDMVADAVSSGSGIDIIDRLMDAQDRYDAKIARKEFDTAMASVQAELPNIAKSNVVSFDSRNGGSKTNYKFEDLATIAAAVRPILTKYGLSFRFRTNQDGDMVSVTCIISHKSGYSEENTLSAKNDNSGNKNSIQAVGSTATYLERYTLKAALGLAASADDDAKGAVTLEAISKDDVAALTDAINNNGIDIAAYCKYFNIKALSEIKLNDLGRAWSAIQSSIKKKAKAQANG